MCSHDACVFSIINMSTPEYNTWRRSAHWDPDQKNINIKLMVVFGVLNEEKCDAVIPVPSFLMCQSYTMGTVKVFF